MDKQPNSRDLKQWQEWATQEEVLKVGVDIAKSSHVACMGSSRKVHVRRLEFSNRKEGIERFEKAIGGTLLDSGCTAVVVAVEPTGSYGKALQAQLVKRGIPVVCVHGKAVKHNRKTMVKGDSKTERRDAYGVYDLLRQGKFFLPVRREPKLQAAHRMMKRYEDSRQRAKSIANQLRAVLEEAFPELSACFKSLGKTASRFLLKNPTPASIVKQGRSRFLKRWAGRCGRWGKKKFEEIYELARNSIGVEDPEWTLRDEIRCLEEERQEALRRQQQWLDKAIELVKDAPEFGLALSVKGIGEKLAVGILTCVGPAADFRYGKQWVKLAGLDLRQRVSGESVRGTPHISRQGDALLRNWLHLAAVNVIRYPGPCQDLYQRRVRKSPGKGAKNRALVAVGDKLIRTLFAMFRDGKAYDPSRDQVTARAYAKFKNVA